MAHQRRIKVFTSNVGTSIQETILSGRARQLIHLWGYKVELSYTSGLTADGDVATALWVLLTLTRDLNLVPTNAGALGQAFVVDAGLWFKRLDLATSGASVDESSKLWPWTPCDLLLPHLAVNSHVTVTPGETSTTLVAVEYSWEDASPAEIAAANLVWGRDPQDFDR